MIDKSTHWLNEQFESNKNRILDEFFTFLRFPSISATAEHKSDLLACADWLAAYLKKMGFQVEFWETGGHPTIFAEWNGAGSNAPTVLVYNHYDVQPVDPLSDWLSPPFEPCIRDGKVYARGAQDNKGQCWYAISAIRTLLEETGSLPVNLKLLIEGEEELGSIGICRIVGSNRDKLKADHLLILDCNIPRADCPAVTLGLRGFLGFEIELVGSKHDLHSGWHGGLAYNANHALAELIASIRDKSGKILIPGFYDHVAPLSAEERANLFQDFDAKQYQNQFGALPIGGERALPPNERRWIRPTLEINGMWGGYTGEGIKTIIPAKANARFTCRLVPDQDPKLIGEQITSFLQNNCPEGFQLNIRQWPGSGRAVRTRADAPVVQASTKAYEEATGHKCRFVFEGWSVPVVADLVDVSGGNAGLIGFGLSTDAIHAPNEHFDIDRLRQGYVMIGRLLQHLGA